MKTNPVSFRDDNRTTLDEVVRDLRAGSDAYNSTKWTAWGLRPIVLFASAYTIIGILHESAHALTAYALKVPSTLFHLYVQLDRANGTLNERAVIRVAGPLFCLAVGLVCWFASRKAKGARTELLLKYLAWFGIGTFFGNLMSTPFVGDFSGLAQAFQLPMAVRYGVGLAGLLSLCGFAFLMGTELRKWAPAGVGRAKAMIGVIAIPTIVGTAIAILTFLPMSSAFAISRVGESTFWDLWSRRNIDQSKTTSGEESRSWLGVGGFHNPISSSFGRKSDGRRNHFCALRHCIHAG